MKRPSDDELSAWLDGELEPERRAEVEAWLQESPDDASRVRQWAADREALARRFDPVLDEPVPTRLQQIVWTRPPQVAAGGGGAWSWPIAIAAACFVAGAAVGVLGERMVTDRVAAAGAEGPSQWVRGAALAHQVYVSEKRHPVEVDIATAAGAQRAELEDHLQRWLTRRVDVPVKLFDLRAEGYELVGGRLLPDEATPAGSSRAMLMYQNANGQRVTVYLRRAADAAPTAFRYEQVGELGLFYWVEGTAGYALAGALPREQLLTLARSIYDQQPTAPR